MDLLKRRDVFNRGVWNNYLEWGPRLWHVLDLTAEEVDQAMPNRAQQAKLRRFYTVVIPKAMSCEVCKPHYRAYLREHPPPVHNRQALIRWVYNFHVAVNNRRARDQRARMASLARSVHQSVSPVTVRRIVNPTFEEVVAHYRMVAAHPNMRGKTLRVRSRHGVPAG